MALWGPDMIKLSLTLLFPYSLQNIIFSSSTFMQTRDPQFVAPNFTHHLSAKAAVLTSDTHSRTWSSLWSSLQSPDSEVYASSLGAGRAAPFSLRHSFFTSTVSKIKFSFFFSLNHMTLPTSIDLFLTCCSVTFAKTTGKVHICSGTSSIIARVISVSRMVWQMLTQVQ